MSATSGFILHRTQEGERWDNLSWRYYADPFGYEQIITANPGVPIYPILPAGIELLIPLTNNSTSVDPQKLPPWLR